jgi:methionyl-tRNA synthetase
MPTPEEGKREAPITPASPAAPSTPAAPGPIAIDDFQKLALRAGKILTAVEHPRADRLLILSVDVGEASPRQVVAGIKGAYQPAELIGKTVVVVANLKPAVLRGVESQGMVLAAQDGSGLTLITAERPLQPGSVVK